MSSSSPTVLTALQVFCDNYPESTFTDGQIIIQAETEPSGIFFLKEGTVVQVTPLLNGDRLIVNYYHSPAFFPMIWAFQRHEAPQALNRHEFIASGTVVGCWSPTAAVLNWLPKHPEVLMDLTARLCRGFDATLAKWEEAHQSSATYLVGQVIIRHAERLGKTTADGKSTINLTHQEIADQAGVTRETASRILSQLANAKLIETGYRKVIIPNLSTLQTWLIKDLEFGSQD